MSMIREVTNIRDEWCDNDKLSAQSIKNLAWYIEYDPLPTQAISLVTDAKLMELVPLTPKASQCLNCGIFSELVLTRKI